MSIRISLRNIHKSFGTKKVLTGVDLDVYSGETLCVIGRSGTGKSVVLRNIIGLLEPDDGTITIDGIRTDHAGPDARAKANAAIGVLFQGAALFDSMNIYENIIFAPKRRGLNGEECAAIAEPLLGKLGLKGCETRMPHELSGGLQKRAGLARALAVGPEIMLYDEPTTGVDPVTASSVNEMILDMKRSLGMTSVVITHDMRSVKKIADRVAMLYNGRVIFNGTADELMLSDDPILVQFREGRSDGPIIVA